MQKKKKIITHNKSYSLEQSPLCNLSYIKKLTDILNVNQDILLSIIKNKAEYYYCFLQGKREIQTPIKLLYDIHNRIASLLARITLPDYLYSGIKNRSYIDNAKAHLNNNVVFTTDIEAFFPSTTRTMLFWFFKEKLNGSYELANILADLCSIDDHLPTGSQISMPLAYWVNAAMFDELYDLAQQHHLTMTVYVDDITFSGKQIPKGFKYQIKQIIKKHKHQIKTEKTKLYCGQSVKEITGLILNDDKLLPPNRKFKKLHQYLTDWAEIIKTPNNKIQVETLYSKVLGLLNYLVGFRPEYRNVIFAIQKEYCLYR